ncbi:hypothetical protein AVEN_130429-1 [Araneus ventricosus]|uniref:Uncharacterized protein n=1 Tax=Araneus ventricosus TaxID=182803 RepID=A0A4Y2N6S9_ARAVE|nr:hypothetical protein AVEN_130429-1 [Araneus ventricosus]
MRAVGFPKSKRVDSALGDAGIKESQDSSGTAGLRPNKKTVRWEPPRTPIAVRTLHFSWPQGYPFGWRLPCSDTDSHSGVGWEGEREMRKENYPLSFLY